MAANNEGNAGPNPKEIKDDDAKKEKHPPNRSVGVEFLSGSSTACAIGELITTGGGIEVYV